MRNLSLSLFAVLCCYCLLPQTHLLAQVDTTAIRFGIGGAYLFNQHRANFDTIPGIASCCRQSYGGAASQGLGISAFAEYPLVKLNDDFTLSVGGRVSYFSGLGANLAAQERKSIVGGEAVIQHELETKLSALAVEPMLTLRYFKRLTLSLGVQLGTYLQPSYQYRERILEPSNITYQNGQTTFNGSNGEIPGVSALQAALVGGVGLELQVNKPGTILPTLEAFYVYPLHSIVRGVEWRVASLRLGASLKFSPYRTTELTAEEIEQRYSDSLKQSQEQTRRALAEARESRKKELTAKIGELRSIFFDDDETSLSDSSSRNIGGKLDLKLSAENFTIRLVKTPFKQHISLLPTIFFGENSSLIPARYKQFSQASDVAKFSLENAAGGMNTLSPSKSAINAYYQLLNIIGKRLQAAPQAMLTLTGTALENEQNPTALAEARVNAVATYLQDVWRVPASRVRRSQRVLPANSSPDEMRSVEISCDAREILQALVLNGITPSVSPPGLRLGLQIAAGQGLKQWDLEITQVSAREALTLHSTQGGATYPETYTWDIRTNPPTSQEDVSIRLSIDDVNNNKFEAPIIAVKVLEEPAKGQITTFVVLSEETMLRQTIRALATPQSRVTGRTTSNTSLLQGLGLPQLQQKSFAKSPFDTSTPEGRIYGRGAQVDIVQ
jgi:hypothetical protein